MAAKIDRLSKLEIEVIETFVSTAQMLGLPKSIGEIYGLLYLSPDPLSRDQIIDKLNISLGSASQGLKQLKAFRAVKNTYVAGSRKDFFVAETEFRKFTAGFFKEEVFPQLESAKERLASLSPLLEGMPEEHLEHYRSRLSKLSAWHSKAISLLKKIIGFIRF